jgi:hypothetical protein
MAGKVMWASLPGVHAWSVDKTVGPWNCVNEHLDVMLVQYFLKSVIVELWPDYTLSKSLPLTGKYDAATHYHHMVALAIFLPLGADNWGVGSQKFKPIESINAGFLSHESSNDHMEMLNRLYFKYRPEQFKDLSVVAGVPHVLQKRLGSYGYTL